MSLTRRQFLLGTVGAGALVTWLPGCNSSSSTTGDGGFPIATVPEDRAVFPHGVASGDPLADRVILWTRVTTKDASPVEVTWVVAKDPGLTDIVARGVVTTGPDRDFTVKVDPTGLTAATTYYYAFTLGETARSVTGRTRTLPSAGLDRVRLAFTSCANYNNGFFNAYRAIANRSDLDVWIHLGDYIYEYADGVYGDTSLGRTMSPPNETITLDDYRKRYALYRSDADLQEIHRQLPLIVVWDDHEVANNAWKDGAENHQPDEGDYQARVRAGTQAFVEWLPIRVPDATLPPKIYRSFPFGDLFDLVMLDTRLIGRDKQAGTDVGGDKGDPAVWTDPNRTMLGIPQEDWLKQELSASKTRGAKWRLLGNQVIFAPMVDPRDNLILFADMWDGYQATRQRIVDHILAQKIDNLVFLTGDIHTSWAIDVALSPLDPAKYDPTTGAGAIAVELVGPAVTSQGLEGDALAAQAPTLLKAKNPQLKYNEVTRKGYVLVDITADRVQGEWYFVNEYKKPNDPSEELAVAFYCESGKPHLVQTTDRTMPKKASAAAPTAALSPTLGPASPALGGAAAGRIAPVSALG